MRSWLIRSIDHTPRRTMLMVLGLALVLRLVVAITVPASGPNSVRCPVCSDAYWYYDVAYNLATKGQYADEFGLSAYRPPITPLFQAAVFLIAGIDNFLAVRFAHVILSVATVAFVGLTAWRMFGHRIGLTCAFLVTINPMIMFYITELLSETIFAFLLSLAFLLWVNTMFAKTHSWLWATATGVAAGLAMLTRPSAMAFPIAVVLWLMLTNRHRLVALSMPMLMGVCLAMSPWVIRNYLLFGNLILFSDNGAGAILRYYVDWLGYDVIALYDGPWPETTDFTQLNPYQHLDPHTRAVFAGKLVVNFCQHQPAQCLIAWLKSYGRMMTPILGGIHTLSTKLIALFTYIPLMAFGLYGLVLTQRYDDPPPMVRQLAWFFFIWFLGFMSVNALTSPEIRYRVPGVDLFLSIFAAVALVVLGEWRSRRLSEKPASIP